jgi:uncharacterized protein YdcH (DUF465 family)
VKKKAEGQLSLAGTEEGEILARLSERVERAVKTIQELRRERDALKAELAQRGEAESEELDRFRRERGEIKDRIENILANLESLDG